MRIAAVLIVTACLLPACNLLENDSEAAVNLARTLDGSVGYFREEGHAPKRLHVCPNDGRAEGETGITPPLDVKCEDGPDGKCVPGTTYPKELFAEHPVWKAIGKAPELPHRFHYNYKWKNVSEGLGKCSLVAEAYRDGETAPAYEWRVEIDESGARHSGNPVEGDETSLMFVTDRL